MSQTVLLVFRLLLHFKPFFLPIICSQTFYYSIIVAESTAELNWFIKNSWRMSLVHACLAVFVLIITRVCLLCVCTDEYWSCEHVYWSGVRVSLSPPSVQLSGHVPLCVGDGGGAVSPRPAHPGDPGQQPPVRLHRQAAVQAALLWVKLYYMLSGNRTQ